MNGSAKLALGILLLWLSMLSFFFAFHPNGVTLNGQPVKNPVEALQWLISEFSKVTASATKTAGIPGATGTTQAPGTTTAGGRG